MIFSVILKYPFSFLSFFILRQVSVKRLSQDYLGVKGHQVIGLFIGYIGIDILLH